MMSVAGNYDYLELITNSKSGSFFFFSHDQKYIIKNMKVRAQIEVASIAHTESFPSCTLRLRHPK